MAPSKTIYQFFGRSQSTLCLRQQLCKLTIWRLPLSSVPAAGDFTVFRFVEFASRIVCLLVVLIGLFTATPATAETELVLHTKFKSKYEKGDISGTMCRELARQALLIAAREELGMRTCDMTLREQKSTADPLELLLTVQAAKEFKVWVFDSGAIDLRDSPPANEKNILELEFISKRGSILTYPSVSKTLEEASRGKFVQFLRDRGAKRAELPNDKNIDLDIDIAALQAKVDLVSQFVAIRELHRRYRVDPTAETLQALVRGYANLGLLNETNFGASCIALQARAILYSARLKALHPDHPQTHWTLAYANSILGLHYRSLKQLKTLDENQNAEKLPPWTALVGPFSRFESGKLEKLSEEESPISNWAAYLNAWTVYNSLEHRRFTSVGRSVVETCPEAMNLYFMLTDNQPIGIMRFSSAAEEKALLKLIPARLIATSTIPKKVVNAAKSPENAESAGEYWRSTIDALRSTKGGGDPSWGMLAALLDDQAMRAAYNSITVNSQTSTEIDLTTIADGWQLFVEGHPDQACIQTVSLARAGDPRRLLEACGDFRFRDPNKWMLWPCWDLWYVKNSEGESIGRFGAGARNREFTCQSLTRAFSTLKPDDKKFQKIYVREIGKVAPQSPVALTRLIRQGHSGKNPIKPEQLAKWQAAAGDSSIAWKELAYAYEKAGNQESTINCFKESIRLSPQLSAYHDLAEAYLRFNMKDKVVPLYKEYLNDVESFGLEHSKVHGYLAKFYIHENDFINAKPHALKSAESYAGFGLKIAANVCELKGDFDEADHFYKALSNSYPSYSGLEWYLYRRSRDDDELEAPKKLVNKFLAASPNWQRDNRVWKPIAYLIAEGKHQAAFKACRVRAENESNLFTEAFLMLTALQVDETATANASKDRLFGLCEKPIGTEGWGQQFRDLMKTTLSAKADTGEVEQKQLTDRCEKFLRSPISALIFKSDRCYIIGKLLQIQGYKEAAARCFQLGISTSQTPERITWRLCSIALNQ